MPRHLIAFWNLENLFAPEGFADREPWIAAAVASDLKGWTEGLFDTKIGQLASIIRQMKDGQGPDILGVCEVENAYVLHRLTERLNGQLDGRDYGLAHADARLDHRGVDTAFLFDKVRYTYDPDALFSHFVMRRTGTRDISQVTFTTRAGNDLIALCNHWPSGAEETMRAVDTA